MKAVAEKEKQARPVAELPFVAPEVNIYETEDGYTLEADMPGVTKDGVEITLEGNTLAFTGRRHDETVPGRVLYRESRALNYRRVFELDVSIDTTKVTAKIDHGVLTLHLPKAEAVKPRRNTTAAPARAT
jgi:HSP20 family protein